MERYLDRYGLLRPWTVLHEGTLAWARDEKLDRPVLLWRTSCGSRAEKEERLRWIAQAARVGDRRFLPILDVEVRELEVCVVLARDGGDRLSETLSRLPWRGTELLERVKDLIPAIREARRERLLDLDVTATNLWLGADGRLRLIDRWTQANGDRRDAKGLSGLLFQIAAGEERLPASLSAFYLAVAERLGQLPGGSGEEAAEWAGRTFLPSFTIKDYETGLESLLREAVGGAGREAVRDPVREPKRDAMKAPSSLGQAKAGAPVTAAAGSESMEEPAAGRVRKNREGSRPGAARIAVELGDGGRRAARTSEERGGGGRQASSEVRRWVRYGLILLAVGLMLVLVLWWMIRLPEEETASVRSQATPGASAAGASASASPAGGSSPAAGVASKKEPAPSTQPAAGNAGAQGGEVGQPNGPEASKTVPNLVGRTLEEASQLALKAGLRYAYRMAPDEMEKGKVYKQDLPPGAPVRPGDRIVFDVSKGK